MIKNMLKVSALLSTAIKSSANVAEAIFKLLSWRRGVLEESRLVREPPRTWVVVHGAAKSYRQSSVSNRSPVASSKRKKPLEMQNPCSWLACMGFMALSMLICFITIIGIATKQRETGKQAFIIPNLKEVCVLQTGDRCFYHPGLYVNSCAQTECASWARKFSVNELGILQIQRVEAKKKIITPDHSLCGPGKWCSGGECVAIPERQPRPETVKLTPEWKEGILCMEFETKHLQDELIGRYFGQESINQTSTHVCMQPLLNRLHFFVIPHYCEGLQSHQPNDLCELHDTKKYSLIVADTRTCDDSIRVALAYRQRICHDIENVEYETNYDDEDRCTFKCTSQSRLRLMPNGTTCTDTQFSVRDAFCFMGICLPGEK
ncbi:hypothetical protein M513_11708 [Trichuris suis]|uniref:Uncharacterized protein n=1 Tax=Trichuris suis TaxID=68888 RepID=A0A085LR01_9BILA|nr:hypothetical protein M513_11708 [Trichuris suis]